MNTYDFDNTIYDGDSTIDFFFHCLKKHPMLLACVPDQLSGAIQYKLEKIDKTKFKEKFYCFLVKLSDVDTDISIFWDSHEDRIKGWYQQRQKEDDVIISASPDFLLKEICDRLGIRHLIASRVDKGTGKFSGLNCHGVEKVRRFYEVFPEGNIEEFYSDSYTDQPLADIAERSFLIEGNQIKLW